MRIVAEHLVAHTRGGDRGLVTGEHASWLWKRLRRALPDAYSCVLMPEHLHTTAPLGNDDRFRNALSGYDKRFGVRFDVADPEPANSSAIAFRMIRYGFFNPRRDGLVEDPWEWRWSTLRDLGGACEPVWTDLSTVAAKLEMAPAEALRRLTRVADYEAPPLATGSLMVASVEAIAAAVAAALRCSVAEAVGGAEGRRLVIHACYAIGQPRAADLAKALGCTVRTVHRARLQSAPALDAVLRCLADQRLLR